MRRLLALVLLQLSCSKGLVRRIGPPPPPPVSDNLRLPQERWFNQTLDHSNPTDDRIWQQRYFVNDEYYEQQGPVFLMLSGVGEANPKWLLEGSMVDHGRHTNALLILLEHRYYGQSHPTNDTSIDNLRFLTNEQALADAAQFISVMREQVGRGQGAAAEKWAPGRWVVFGGNLAAWLRLKFPHLVHAAMCASGPVLAKVDFFEYVNVVKASLDTYSPNCSQAVRKGNYLTKRHLNTTVGRESVRNLFRLCHPITSDINDIYTLVDSLSYNFALVVQYNKNNGEFPTRNITIDTVCDIMTNVSLGDHMHRYAAVNSLLMDAYEEDCLYINYNEMIEEMRDPSWDSIAVKEGARQWFYLTCTELGYCRTSESVDQLFRRGFPLPYFLSLCQDIYGLSSDMVYRGVNRTNIIYGGLDLKASRVVYVHGSIDPWHPLGITQSDDPDAPAIYINGTAHYANMYPGSESDLPALKEARIQIEDLINGWLLKD